MNHHQVGNPHMELTPYMEDIPIVGWWRTRIESGWCTRGTDEIPWLQKPSKNGDSYGISLWKMVIPMGFSNERSMVIPMGISRLENCGISPLDFFWGDFVVKSNTVLTIFFYGIWRGIWWFFMVIFHGVQWAVDGKHDLIFGPWIFIYTHNLKL